MPYATLKNIKLHYEVVGEGNPLLLIHGLGSSGQDWAFQVDVFSRDYKVITIDHTKVNGTDFHINFPLLISIIDSDLKNNAQIDGDDIAFAIDNVWSDHEIEFIIILLVVLKFN